MTLYGMKYQSIMYTGKLIIVDASPVHWVNQDNAWSGAGLPPHVAGPPGNQASVYWPDSTWIYLSIYLLTYLLICLVHTLSPQSVCIGERTCHQQRYHSNTDVLLSQTNLLSAADFCARWNADRCSISLTYWLIDWAWFNVCSNTIYDTIRYASTRSRKRNWNKQRQCPFNIVQVKNREGSVHGHYRLYGRRKRVHHTYTMSR